MFDWARAAGLPMLGGFDVYAYYRDASVRAHFWAAGQQAKDPNDKYKVAGAVPSPPKLQKTIVIFPGFTEFCEKYSKEGLRFHERGYNVLVIDNLLGLRVDRTWSCWRRRAGRIFSFS